MKKMTIRSNVAFIIPAWNEERVIAHTIESLMKFADKHDIYVVDDGSVDRTSEIAMTKLDNVLTLHQNVGKANAMNTVINFYNLPARYDYIIPMDGDSIITKDFIDNTVGILESDENEEIACVVGKVMGSSKSWVTTFRLWEYEVAQTIHKTAQSYENAVIVCPGCATVYRSRVFENIKVPTGTLTEDMDMTFLIHRKNLGKIVYTSKAQIITQDPLTLKDLLKQIDRWYTGFWQCIIKNNIPWGGQMLDVEVALLATEGLFNGVLVLAMLILAPFTVGNHPQVLAIPLIIDLVLFLLPTMLLTAIKHRNWMIFLYTPMFYLARILCCLVFLKSFVKTVIGLDINMSWNKAARYQPV
jgi:cellulose synthase/poly-beta-1,6-N-acetylglucosamine synthase-like glycosyltransferase